MVRPGIPGWRARRLVAAAVFVFAVFETVVTARRHATIRLGRIHEAIPHPVANGARFLLLLAVVALLGSIWGLLHGKRQAWRVATAAAAASLILHAFKRADIAGGVASGAILVLLLAKRSRFPARSDPARVRTGLFWLALGELGVFTYGVAGIFLLDHDFAQGNSLGVAAENAARLLFVLAATTIDTETRYGDWFIASVRVLATAVLTVGVILLFRPVAYRRLTGVDDRRRVRTILDAYGANGLAYFHLLEDKSIFFSEDGLAFISYRVVGHIAVALGEPVGPPASCALAASEFAQFCDLNGWAFCFWQVTEAGADLLKGAGLRAMKVGEEGIIPLAAFSLGGKSFKHIRHTVNQLANDGVRVEELPAPIDDATMAELREVSDAWLQAGGHRERTFTLGAFNPAYLRATKVLVAREAGGRIAAFVNVLPSFAGANGNFDLMRRRPDSPAGVMDLILVRLAERFREEGREGMNLGFAPLANVDSAGPASAALRLIYERGGRAFNFKGLRTYKEKWRPRWEPRYLVYRSDVQLPQVALAVARVGERGGSLPMPAISLRRRRKATGQLARSS